MADHRKRSSSTSSAGHIPSSSSATATASSSSTSASVGDNKKEGDTKGDKDGEFVDDDGCGDAHVRGDGDGVAGVVVDPAEDFGVVASCEPPVGEVGLPAFVGLFGGEADVGRFGSFVGAGLHEAGGVEVSADGGDGHVEAAVVV